MAFFVYARFEYAEFETLNGNIGQEIERYKAQT